MVFASAGKKSCCYGNGGEGTIILSSSLVCIAWSLLNIISNSEYSLLKNEHLLHILYHQWLLHLQQTPVVACAKHDLDTSL